MWNWIKSNLLSSRKFWATIAAIIAAVSGVDDQTVELIVQALMAFVVGVGVQDAGKEYAKYRNDKQ